MSERLKTICSRLANRTPTLGITLALALATLLVYLPVRHYNFVDWDDRDYVSDNDHVRGGISWRSVVWAFTQAHSANWHPLTWLSHMLDCQLFGLQPEPHHLVNVGFHVLNVLLLFTLLRVLTQAVWRSAFVAALFALHPVHVESVAWIAERKDVLSTFFFLLTLLAYAQYVRGDTGPVAPRRSITRSVCWYLLSLVLFAFGLMSKPMVVTLPCVLLLLDYWPFHRFAARAPETSSKTWCRLLLEKSPFFALAAASSVVTLLVQRQAGAMATIEVLPLSARTANAAVAYTHYLLSFLWPANLSPIYLRPEHWAWWHVGGATLLLLVLTSTAWTFRKRFPFALVGWLWFLGTLVPVIGLIQVGYQAFADRYTYIPLAGLAMALVWLAGEAISALRTRKPVAARLLPWVVGTVVLMAMAWTSSEQLTIWKNSETLFRRALALTPNSLPALLGLGPYLIETGRGEEGLGLLREAIRLYPDNPKALGVIGDALEQLGFHQEAIEAYQTELQLQPDDARVLNNLAWLRATCADPSLQDATEALRLATRACELTAYTKPLTLQTLAAAQAAAGDFPSAIATADRAGTLAEQLGLKELAGKNHGIAGNLRYRQGIALQLQGKGVEALPYLNSATVSPSEQPERNYRLGLSLIAAGRLPEAAEALDLALKAKPDNTQYRLGMAALRHSEGRADQAEQIFREILAVHPDLLEAQRSYAHFLDLQGRGPEALSHYAQAARLAPNDAALWCTYAAALTKAGQNGEAMRVLEIAAQRQPDHASLNFDLADLLSQEGKNREAVDRYNRVLIAEPTHLSALNNLAWLLATDPDDNLRNGVQAVQLAERACQLTHWKVPMVMGTLAAAYAEASRFSEAIATAERARDLARADGLEEVAKRNGELLKLYHAGKPFREQGQPAR